MPTSYIIVPTGGNNVNSFNSILDNEFNLGGNNSLFVTRDAFIWHSGFRGVSGNQSSITNLGQIYAEQDGVAMSASGLGSTAQITNESSGVISGGRDGITLSGNLNSTIRVTNHGSISGVGGVLGPNGDGISIGVDSPTSGDTFIVNTGTISGIGAGHAIYATANTGSLNITNTGTLIGGIQDQSINSTMVLTNTGLIQGSVEASGTGLVFDGSGGQVSGDIYSAGTGFAFFRGLGATVSGAVYLLNSGGVFFDGTAMNISSDVVLSNAADSVLGLQGGLIVGNLSTGGGADTVNIVGGTVRGGVLLGAGDDSFTGGDAIDKVNGGEGNDTVDLGGGNDVFTGSGDSPGNDGNDDVDGGDGIDSYNAITPGLTGVTIDLLDGIATGVLFGTDQILNFENAVGTQNADILLGSLGANRLNGGAGIDRLEGLDDADRLFGGLGADTIIGGAGRDVMTGGAVISGGDLARDTFVFSSLTDSGPTSGARDWITDFTNGLSATSDRINLVAIDANTTGAAVGDQMFTWVGLSAFSGAAGELRYVKTATNTFIYGDVNGDQVADFSIGLSGLHTLAGTDFLL